MPSKPNSSSAAASPRRPLAPWRWAQAFFSHQLRLKRSERGLTLALVDPHQAAAPAPAPAAPAPETPAQAMRRELGALLDAVPHSRSALRHLAAVERGLRDKDAEGLFLFDIAPPQLQTALRQLASLGVDATPTPGLARLSTVLLDALAAQEERLRRQDQSQVVSSFLVDDKLEVVEVSASVFDDAAGGLSLVPRDAGDRPDPPAPPEPPPRG